MSDPVLSRDDLRAAADIRADLLNLRDSSAFGDRYRDAVHRLARDAGPLLAELDRVEGELQAARVERDAWWQKAHDAWGSLDEAALERIMMHRQLADARRTLDELRDFCDRVPGYQKVEINLIRSMLVSSSGTDTRNEGDRG